MTLSRLSPQAAPQISALLGALTLDPKGRQIIADRLKNEPLLLTVASEALKAGLDGDGLLDLITRSNFSSDRELMTRAQSLVASQLLREKRYEDARSAWFKIAASDPEEEIFDPKFEGLSGGAPFNWVLNTNSQVETSLQPKGANTPSALRVRAYTSLPLTAASQSLVLSPGTYELSYRASAEGGLEADPVFAWQIACTPGSLIDETTIKPEGADWKLADHSFSVPEDCPMQNLKLVKLRTTTARAQELLVSEVTVTAAQIK